MLIVTFLVMAAFPRVFTSTSPTAFDLGLSSTPPSSSQWFGRDLQGYDVFARTIYGARASILVGVLTTVVTAFLGVVIGTLAGYYGGILDTLVMRLTDVFFAIPFVTLFAVGYVPGILATTCAAPCSKSSPTTTSKRRAPWAPAPGASSDRMSCPMRWRRSSSCP